MTAARSIPAIPLEANAQFRKNRLSEIAIREIIVRDERHARDFAMERHWLGGDRVATAWFTALSISFPRGEAFFIESLRKNSVTLPPLLADDAAAFIAQEANHAREHRLFNQLIRASGHDISAIDARLEAFIAQTSQTHNFVNLVVTAALEHFTAIIAHDVLTHAPLAAADPQIAALWRWHAVEEIEHKAVCYEVWMHVARKLSPWRRWRIRCLIMLKVSALFLAHRQRDVLELLAQDGMAPRAAKRALRAYLWGRNGALRRILPLWAQWFKPGFHPWQHNNRALITQQTAD
jgi:predicted metal-dependent hydrolase